MYTYTCTYIYTYTYKLFLYFWKILAFISNSQNKQIMKYTGGSWELVGKRNGK